MQNIFLLLIAASLWSMHPFVAILLVWLFWKK